MPRYIGGDLHTNCFTVRVLTGKGENSFQEYKLSGLASFQKTLRRSDQLAVEATGNARFFYEQVRERVRRIVVVNPRQFEVIKQSRSKTDKRDAYNLALYLSKGLLPEARMKSETGAQLSSLVQTREKLVKARTQLKNKLHALLISHGLESKKEAYSSERGLERVLAVEAFGEITRIEAEVIVSQIRSLSQSIRRLDEEIERQVARLEGHDSLTSIKGIGTRSATILLSVIGKVEDFGDENKLASYFGVVPVVKQSNETEWHGRITKSGSKLGRTTLVQCTLVAIRYSPYLKRFYERTKARRGTGKAIIARARKFLGIVYRTLKNKWVFADFPNFVLAEQ
jgi:transposase